MRYPSPHSDAKKRGDRLINRKAFTLIELLVVVGVIAILAAIALPNFLEAQTRAKVSRAMADMRTIGVALESYGADFNSYPKDWDAGVYGGNTPPPASGSPTSNSPPPSPTSPQPPKIISCATSPPNPISSTTTGPPTSSP